MVRGQNAQNSVGLRWIVNEENRSTNRDIETLGLLEERMGDGSLAAVHCPLAEVEDC